MNGSRGWFADWDNDATTESGWQPCLETGQGHIPCFQIWFSSRAECEQWIADNVIGVEWLPPRESEATNGGLCTPCWFGHAEAERHECASPERCSCPDHLPVIWPAVEGGGDRG